MSRLEFNATELTNTDVDFVALVKRGANRIPFRIVKGDNTMIDLASLGRKIFQKADKGPGVAAILTGRSGGQTAARLAALAKTCGMVGPGRITKSDDGVTTLLLGDKLGDGAVLVKLDRSFALALSHSNLRKSFENYDFAESLFKDVDGSHGHFVGPAAATALFTEYATDVVKSAGNPNTLSHAVAKAADDLKSYLGALSVGLPDHALKADQLIKAWADDEDEDSDDDGAGGTDDDGDDASGKGDADNGKDKATKASSFGRDLFDEGDPGEADPEMPVKKADAGKNGTGAGFMAGGGTSTDARATSDDASNTEIDAKPGAAVSGDSSGLPGKLKAPTRKSVEVAKAELAVAEAKLALAKAEAHGLPDPKGESQAGEGAAQAVDHRDTVSDEDVTGADNVSKVKGKTLDMKGIPAGAKSPTTKNDGDGDIGKKGTGRELADELSGAGAQEADVQTMKSENAAVMQAIQALAKSVQDSNAAVTKTVTDLGVRVEKVAAMAKKTDAALNGTVFNEATDDTASRTTKSEGGAPPLLDTGFSRRHA